MKMPLAVLFTFIGLAVAVYGIGGAVLEVAQMYQANLNDAMSGVEGGEEAASGRILRSAMIGAAGVPFLIIGAVLFKVAFVKQKQRAKRVGL